MKALILAAGYGTRFTPHSQILPKPAFPFLNIPLIFFPLYLIDSCLSLKELIVNTHHLPHVLPSLFEKYQWTFPYRFSYEENILGSGGGLTHAKQWLQDEEEFILCNGDELIFPTSREVLQTLLKKHRSEKALATLLVMKHPKLLSQFGAVWSDSYGQAVGFGKTPLEGATPWHFTGLQILSSRIFDYLPTGPSHIFQDAMMPAIRNYERIALLEDSALWLETGNLYDYLTATQTTLENLSSNSPHWLLKETLQRFTPHFEITSLPTSTKGSNGMVLLGEECQIATDVETQNFAVLGDRVRVEKGVRLDQVVIAHDKIIPAHTTLKSELILS